MNVIRFKQRFKFLRTKLRQAIANGRGISGKGQAAEMFRQMKDSLRAWVAHAEHGNTWKLRTKLLWEQKF